eukprot:7606491-Alexandrium_andersonii.AAC.1
MPEARVPPRRCPQGSCPLDAGGSRSSAVVPPGLVSPRCRRLVLLRSRPPSYSLDAGGSCPPRCFRPGRFSICSRRFRIRRATIRGLVLPRRRRPVSSEAARARGARAGARPRELFLDFALAGLAFECAVGALFRAVDGPVLRPGAVLYVSQGPAGAPPCARCQAQGVVAHSLRDEFRGTFISVLASRRNLSGESLVGSPPTPASSAPSGATSGSTPPASSSTGPHGAPPGRRPVLRRLRLLGLRSSRTRIAELPSLASDATELWIAELPSLGCGAPELGLRSSRAWLQKLPSF